MVLTVAVAAIACGTSGTELRDPPVGATSPAPTVATTLPPTIFTAWSPDFGPGAVLPPELTCHGEGRSPALQWAGLPTDAVEVAVTVTSRAVGTPSETTDALDGDPPGTAEGDDTADDDAAAEGDADVVASDDTQVHWVLWGLAPGNTGLDAGAIPLEAVEGTNSQDEPGWWAPCPEGDEPRSVAITVHALRDATTLAPDTNPDEAVAALLAAPGERAVVTATAALPDGDTQTDGDTVGGIERDGGELTE